MTTPHRARLRGGSPSRHPGRAATTSGPSADSASGGLSASLHRVGQLRIPELLLFFALIFETSFGLPLPANYLVILAILVLAMTRKPQFDLGRMQFLIPLLVVGLFYIGMVSMFSDPTEFAADWKRRIIRMMLTAALLFVMASGRIHMRSALTGFGAGLAVNAVAFYAGFAPDHYGGVLSGFFEDKNVAGLAYAAVGVLMVSLSSRPVPRVLLFLGFGVLVYLTDSRTSMTAYAAAALWMLIAPRLPLLGRWLLGGLIWVAVVVASEDFSRIGRFSEREGSDLLRSRIDAASEIKVGQAGFFGNGLGEAYVYFDADRSTWYFHNSYWTTLVEGGWPWAVLLVGMTVAIGLRPFAGKLTSHEVIAQAATIATLICAWRLGEVLFTMQWAIIMAFALQARLVADGAIREQQSGVGRKT
ncbi:ABC transporter permease [Brachybacterium phenoliresistens]|uniref:ABC transporter permease n=1 Tax=Brachybacterium phenoliresistens TaxID=396014 RepID=UPI0012EBF39D|nr:ABC transporter permease [Brachybacterium phenoliresistens]